MTEGPAPAAPDETRLPVSTKLAYGVGSVAYGIKDNGFQTLLLLFYNQVVGLPADRVGLVIMLALIADAFVDPLIGHFSDHLRTRWGRRHPFMYAAALPIGLLYVLLWNPPTGGDPNSALFWLAGIAILVRTAISSYEVPSSALSAELTADYHERTALTGYRYMFGWLGGMGMLLLTFAVLLAPDAAHPVGQLNPDGYRHYSYVAAGLMTAAILLSASGTHHRIGRLPQASGVRPPLWRTFHEILSTLSNRAFLVLFLAGVCAYTNQGLVFALATYFNTYLFLFPAATLTIYTLAVIVGVMIGVILARVLSARLGKKIAALTCLAAYPPLVVSAPVGLQLGILPAPGTPLLLPVIMLLFALSTAAGVGMMVLMSSMMADVVEDAQARTGVRREGVFFAGAFFMQKCVSGFGLFLSGAILAAVHFPARATPGHVPPEVLGNLITIYSSIILSVAILAGFILWRFPLGGQAEHERRLAELAAGGLGLPGSEGEPAAVALAER